MIGTYKIDPPIVFKNANGRIGMLERIETVPVGLDEDSKRMLRGIIIFRDDSKEIRCSVALDAIVNAVMIGSEHVQRLPNETAILDVVK